MSTLSVRKSITHWNIHSRFFDPARRSPYHFSIILIGGRSPTICGSHRFVVGSATSTDRRDLRAAIDGAEQQRILQNGDLAWKAGSDPARTAAGPLVGPAVSFGG